jgi:hypothetical protein
MNARPLLVAGLALAVLLSPACASHRRHGDAHGLETPAGERWLSHAVYFELADDSPAAVAQLEADCWALLSDLPGVRHFGTGTPALELDREVNDLDFDLALYVVFDSMEAHDAYQVSEPHQELLTRYAGGFTRVRVFDAWGESRALPGGR